MLDRGRVRCQNQGVYNYIKVMSIEDFNGGFRGDVQKKLGVHMHPLSDVPDRYLLYINGAQQSSWRGIMHVFYSGKGGPPPVRILGDISNTARKEDYIFKLNIYIKFY